MMFELHLRKYVIMALYLPSSSTSKNKQVKFEEWHGLMFDCVI